MIGCDCEVCRSPDPRDRRNRTSLAVQLPTAAPTDGRVILIDTPPEFRLAAIANRLARVDAILLTHAHSDHIAGMDDIRRYNEIGQRRIECYSDAATIATVGQSFAYANREYRHDGWPSLDFRIIDSPQTICGCTVQPVPLVHGRQQVLGYRIGQFAYCTDCSAIPDSSLKLLEDLDLLILDGLRYTPHWAHFNISQALAVVAQLKPRRTILTHLAHEIHHERTSRELPAGVELAFDGLRVLVDSFKCP